MKSFFSLLILIASFSVSAVSQGSSYTSLIELDDIEDQNFSELDKFKDNLIRPFLRSASRTDFSFVENDESKYLLYTSISVMVISSEVVRTPAVLQKIEVDISFETSLIGGQPNLGRDVITISGVGKTQNEAYLNAVKKINQRKLQAYYRTLIKEVDDYLSTNCGSILERTKEQVQDGNAAIALFGLSLIPEKNEGCYKKSNTALLTHIADQNIGLDTLATSENEPPVLGVANALIGKSEQEKKEAILIITKIFN
tara:strand:- start:63940 stop:64704 length:765 start_codon:yes stop_codon:yes gene_type:complete